MDYLSSPPAPVSVPVVGHSARFPVHRIYCVGRNYEEHAKEMGFTGREPPFFFLKPADALVVVNAGETGSIPYPTLTQNLHHEIEVVVAIGATPNVDWLKSSRLQLGNGVQCDECCRSSGGIYAAGDVAEWFHPGYGRRMRIEHRTNAAEQALAVATNMLGGHVPYAPMPFFWSD